MSKKTVEKHLSKILEFIDIAPEIKITEDKGTYKIEITGDNLSFLIGYRGESLDALQYILSQLVYKDLNVWTPIVLDINGYKMEKLEKLDGMIKSMIDRVRFHQKEMVLPLLSAFERRYVHTYVSDYVDVKSESRGEGKDRRLYLIPVKK